MPLIVQVIIIMKFISKQAKLHACLHCISKFKIHNWFKFYAAVRVFVLFCFVFFVHNLRKIYEITLFRYKAQNEAKRKEKKRRKQKKKRENWGGGENQLKFPTHVQKKKMPARLPRI